MRSGVRKESGGVTLLMVAVLVPMLFFFLTTTAEISAFFQSRQAVQEAVDRAAKHLSRNPTSRGYVERSIRSNLRALGGMVELASVEMFSASTETRVAVSARHRAHISALFLTLTGYGADGIPFTVRSAVKRIPTEATVILDRSIVSGDGCLDSDFTRMKYFTGELISGLSQIGVSRAAIGVVPGVTETVQRVALRPLEDELPRCGSTELFASLADSLQALRGVHIGVADPMGAAMGIQEFMFGDRASVPISRQLIFLVTNNFDSRWNTLHEVNDLLSSSAQVGGMKILLRHVALLPVTSVAAIEAANWKSDLVDGIGLDSRLIEVGAGEAMNPSLLTAILSSVDTMAFAE